MWRKGEKKNTRTHTYTHKVVTNAWFIPLISCGFFFSLTWCILWLRFFWLVVRRSHPEESSVTKNSGRRLHFTSLRSSRLRNLKHRLVCVNTCVDKSLMSKIYHLPQTKQWIWNPVAHLTPLHKLHFQFKLVNVHIAVLFCYARLYFQTLLRRLNACWSLFLQHRRTKFP